MASGRIRQSARRGLGAAVLGWLGMATAAVLLAPSASAAPTATVTIRDLTPPVASVDAGGSVTFVNEIAAKTVRVPVTNLAVTVRTDVTLSLPSGNKPLAPGQRVTERFASTCTSCAITYTYRAEGAPLSAVVGQLPALPARTPFVVQTIVPDLPELPTVNVPELPAVEVPPVPGPGDPPVPAPGPAPAPRAAPAPAPGADGGPAAGPAPVSGNQYSYSTSGGVRMSPADAGAAAAFDPARFSGGSDSFGTGGGSGSGGLPGGYDGASVPVFGELAGLSGAELEEESSGEELAGSSAAAQTLPVAALAAVVALATVTAALVRTHQAQRTSKR